MLGAASDLAVHRSGLIFSACSLGSAGIPVHASGQAFPRSSAHPFFRARHRGGYLKDPLLAFLHSAVAVHHRGARQRLDRDWVDVSIAGLRFLVGPLRLRVPPPEEEPLRRAWSRRPSAAVLHRWWFAGWGFDWVLRAVRSSGRSSGSPASTRATSSTPSTRAWREQPTLSPRAERPRTVGSAGGAAAMAAGSGVVLLIW